MSNTIRWPFVHSQIPVVLWHVELGVVFKHCKELLQVSVSLRSIYCKIIKTQTNMKLHQSLWYLTIIMIFIIFTIISSWFNSSVFSKEQNNISSKILLFAIKVLQFDKFAIKMSQLYNVCKKAIAIHRFRDINSLV